MGALFLQAVASVPAVAQPTTLEKDGWWNAMNSTVSGPQGPLGLPAPPPSTVPANALGVGARNGEVDKVAAVGLILETELGSVVSELRVTMKEASGTGAQVNSSTANVVACPITTFWAPARNGPWNDRPGFDCTLDQVAGQRGSDGSWVFELTSFAELWLDPDDPLDMNGYALTIDPSQGASTAQVSFMDVESGGLLIEFEAAPPVSETEDTTDTFTPPTTDFTFDEPSFTAPAPSSGGTTVPAEPTAAPEVVFAERAQGRNEVIVEPNLGNLPWYVLLLLPILLIGGALIAYALGPQGRPGTASMRTGAVSRALSRREPVPPPDRS